jgi:triacylglycerol lipase
MSDFPWEPDVVYSDRTALAFGLLSQLASESEQRIFDQTRAWHLPQCRFFSRAGTRAVVAANEWGILVAFCGTEPVLEDWLADVDVPKVPGPRGQVHRGFLSALDVIWSDVVDAIQAFRSGDQGIWLTGHSLGAALAVLATARLEFGSDVRTSGLYTFGSPRVGDTRFQRFAEAQFGQRNFRFANHGDMVTRVPFEWMGYDHVGQVRYFDADGNLHEDASAWFEFTVQQPVGDLFQETLAGDLAGKKKASSRLQGILDTYRGCHSIDRYVELLTEAAQQEAGTP